MCEGDLNWKWQRLIWFGWLWKHFQVTSTCHFLFLSPSVLGKDALFMLWQNITSLNANRDVMFPFRFIFSASNCSSPFSYSPSFMLHLCSRLSADTDWKCPLCVWWIFYGRDQLEVWSLQGAAVGVQKRWWVFLTVSHREREAERDRQSKRKRKKSVVWEENRGGKESPA